MNKSPKHTSSPFSIMPIPIFLVWGILFGWCTHYFTDNIWVAITAGILSFPLTIWVLDLVFNNPWALKFQNYAGNHCCPTCQNRYQEYMSRPSKHGTIILKCLKCGASHRFDKKYNHIEAVEIPEPNSEPAAGGNASRPTA